MGKERIKESRRIEGEDAEIKAVREEGKKHEKQYICYRIWANPWVLGVHEECPRQP